MSIPNWIREQMELKPFIKNASALHRAMVKKGFVTSQSAVYTSLSEDGSPSDRTMADFEKFFGSKYQGG